MVTYLQYVGAPTFLSLHDNSRQQDRPASLLRRASRGGPYTNFQPSTLNFEPPFLGSGNILRGGCVLLDSGARGCLPRRG